MFDVVHDISDFIFISVTKLSPDDFVHLTYNTVLVSICSENGCLCEKWYSLSQNTKQATHTVANYCTVGRVLGNDRVVCFLTDRKPGKSEICRYKVIGLMRSQGNMFTEKMIGCT